MKDLSQIVFWSKEVLNEIDSQIIRQQYKDTNSYYQVIFKQMTENENSPYKGKNSVSLEEFMWAFNIVSSRHLVLNNDQSGDDPNLLLMIMPIFDFINHSFDPNVVALPYHDKINDESFILLQALKDIKKDD